MPKWFGEMRGLGFAESLGVPHVRSMCFRRMSRADPAACGVSDSLFDAARNIGAGGFESVALQGDGYAVKSVQVQGPAPLLRADLELRPGITAVYGLNGAGKTRLLRAVRAAVSLQPPPADGKYELLLHGPDLNATVGQVQESDVPFLECVGD